MDDAKQEFYAAILKMTFGDIQEVASDLQIMATDNPAAFDINDRDQWAWLLYGYAEANIEQV